jgi:hypothetical protein
MNVYAGHGSPDFNQSLHLELVSITADIAAVLGTSMEALVLGGGYGRGEGGVVEVDRVQVPYNDLDLFLFVKPGALPGFRALPSVLEPHARRLGIHVDVSRPIRLDEIRRWSPALMWLDLLEGHKVLAGPADTLTSRAPAWLGRPLPPIEAMRLLLNRGAGLLWSMRIVRDLEMPPDPEFVRRNAYKAALALGDALLILHQRYRSKSEGRDLLFQTLADEVFEVGALDVVGYHREGLAFKFRPDRASRLAWSSSDLDALCGAFVRVFRAVEPRCHDVTPGDPALAKAPGAPFALQDCRLRRQLRHAVQNLRHGRLSLRSPRNRLYQGLPQLLAPSAFDGKTWPAKSSVWLDDWRLTL